VDSGADLDGNGMGRTALIRAAQMDDLEMVKLLVEAGANVDGQDNLGINAFMCACWNSSVDVVKYLRAAGSWMHLSDKDGMTALHIASVRDNTPVMKLLLEWRVFDVDVRSSDGKTPLHCAALTGSYPACKLLIDAGADVNAQVSDGRAIETVADAVASFGEPRLMQLLIDSSLVFPGDGGLLRLAARFGTREMFEFLRNAAEWPERELEEAMSELAEAEEGRRPQRTADFL
jgi:ankyrin repeat protein